MKRVLMTAATVLGLVTSGLLAGIVTTAGLEGLRAVPDPIPALGGIVVFLGAVALAGRVASELAGRRAPHAAGTAVVVVAALGWILTTATDAHGERLEVTTIVQLGAGLAILLAIPILALRRRPTDGQLNG